MRRFVITAFALVLSAVASVLSSADAPVRCETAMTMLREDPNRAGVNTYCYPFKSHPLTPAPKGYSPVYLYHYSRHGARSSWGSDPYYSVINVLSAAQKGGFLSDEGAALLAETKACLEAYDGMDGRLTRRGEEELTRLAGIIYSQYPSVFKKGSKYVRVQSSIIPRSIVSMTCFTNELLRHQKDLKFTIDCGEKYFWIVANQYRQADNAAAIRMIDEFEKTLPCDTVKVFSTLFTDPAKGRALVKRPESFEMDICNVAKTAVPLGVAENMFRYLPEDVIYKFWDRNVRGRYLGDCNSKEFGTRRLFQADPLLKNFVENADQALKDRNVASDMMFGHERPVLAMASYLGLEGVGESIAFDDIPFKFADPEFSPFATNLQVVFCRNSSGDVLVKAVFNGRERKIIGLEPVSGPYYRWSDLKEKISTRAALRTEIVPEPSSLKYTGAIHTCTGESVEIDSKLAPEQYVLDTKGPVAAIRAGSDAGVFYARQTLRQIRIQHPDGKLPGLMIEDKPAFAYRGALLDCCRYFYSVEEVKKFIDIIAAHKINVFHWHLTDDQGWRVEIKKYPKLAEISSMRKETLVGHLGKKPRVFDGKPYGGYYTQDQLREVVRYAQERFVTVIPEIEMPGHFVSVLAAYPELGCTGGPYEVETKWGIFPDILCAGKPQGIRFLHDVLDEVCEIFPSEYIHIGGDEAPRVRWENCPDCQAMMKKMGYTREAQLQSMIIADVEKYLAAKGRRIIGWDEILDGGVEKTATVMSWRGADGGKKAAALGNDVVMVPNRYFYFDYYQTANPYANGEPLGIGGYVPMKKVYSYNPYEDIKPSNRKYIKGVQCNIWCEYISNFDHVQKMLLPRLAAACEIAWSEGVRDRYEDFIERCRRSLIPLYEAESFKYSPYVFQDVPVK